MRVYVNLDTNEPVVSPTLTQRVNTFYFVRRDIVPVEVQFVRNGSVVELGAGATGAIGLKKTYTGDFLANDSGWTKSGTGADTIYQFDLNLNTTELSAEFNPDASTDSITCKLEISWSVSGTTSSTMPTSATIYNDVIRGTEGSPNFATVLSQFDLRAPDNSTWRITVDNDGSLTATKQ
jgi:hypothetical protein